MCCWAEITKSFFCHHGEAVRDYSINFGWTWDISPFCLQGPSTPPLATLFPFLEPSSLGVPWPAQATLAPNIGLSFVSTQTLIWLRCCTQITVTERWPQYIRQDRLGSAAVKNKQTSKKNPQISVAKRRISPSCYISITGCQGALLLRVIQWPRPPSVTQANISGVAIIIPKGKKAPVFSWQLNALAQKL